jgi:hypothetical protein
MCEIRRPGLTKASPYKIGEDLARIGGGPSIFKKSLCYCEQSDKIW